MKNAVLYLTRSTDSNLEDLSHSLDLLQKNFLPSSPADVFIFHEPDMDMGKLREKTQMVNPIFCKVDFSSIPPAASGLPRFQVGYRHMCRFFSNELFLRPELEGYDYVMREDVDSSILSPLSSNLFEIMQSHHYGYAYRGIFKDKPWVCTDLWETGDAYFKKAKIPLQIPMYSEIKKNMMFYTNFEIYEMAWFRGAAWQDFFKAIDEAQGIWRYRWGDNVIRYLGVKALMPPERIWCATPLHYKHVYTWKAGSSHRYLPRLLQCYAQTACRLLQEKFKHV